jgi:DNA-binding MarR family transcriptional regulator
VRNASAIQQQLQRLGLTGDEAAIFISLLGTPKTQLDVSRATGIVRSNVYRIVDGMIEKGLVHELTTDEGKLLAAARPESLELLVIEQEIAAQTQRAGLDQLLPMLAGFRRQDKDFAIKTYSGLGGLKQMLWNELKAQGETLLFSGDTIDRATGRRWAEKYRAEVIGRGLRQRSIENYGVNPTPLSAHPQYTAHYQVRYIAKDVLDIKLELSIHDDTISIYNSLAHKTHLGTEITNPFLASLMRQVFEQYWSVASAGNSGPQAE